MDAVLTMEWMDSDLLAYWDALESAAVDLKTIYL